MKVLPCSFLDFLRCWLLKSVLKRDTLTCWMLDRQKRCTTAFSLYCFITLVEIQLENIRFSANFGNMIFFRVIFFLKMFRKNLVLNIIAFELIAQKWPITKRILAIGTRFVTHSPEISNIINTDLFQCYFAKVRKKMMKVLWCTFSDCLRCWLSKGVLKRVFLHI